MKDWTKHWWWVMLAVVVAIGLGRVRFDVDVLNLLPEDLASVRGLKLYQECFADARELILTVRAPSSEIGERFASELAARLRRETNLVAEASWQPPWMEEPAQAAEMVASLWYNQPPEVFAGLTNRLSPEHRSQVLQEAREALTTSLSPIDIARRGFDPYDLVNPSLLTNFAGVSVDQLQHMFGSSDGTFRLVFAEAREDLGGYQAWGKWLGAIRRVVEETRTCQPEWKEVVVHLTGRPAFVAEIGSGMQRDLRGSVTGTALVIAALFWLTHRRWLPMFWLLFLLTIILVGTMGLGSLIVGRIHVVSLGFAAVLLGLAVDYAVVHYQEALAHPQLSVPEIRLAISPSILWAAITTIGAFLVLNVGGLPGLAQFGLLVAIGVSLAALVMVVAFLPPLFPGRREMPAGTRRGGLSAYLFPPPPERTATQAVHSAEAGRTGLVGTGVVILAAVVVLWRGFPGVDRSGDALRLRHTEAEQALEEMSANVGISNNQLWAIAAGATEVEVCHRLERTEALLSAAQATGVIAGYLVPASLWPRVEHQMANREAALWLAGEADSLRALAFSEGFSTNALFLTEEVARYFAQLAAAPAVRWPTNRTSQWLLKRFVAHSSKEWLSMGLVYPSTNEVPEKALVKLGAALEREHVLLSGWPLLGPATLARVKERLWALVLATGVLVLASLWLAFRNLREVFLSLAVLGLAGLCLLGVMALTGWSWNLLNLMALPLIMGAGVDYGIFIQLGLRRHGGDVSAVRRSIGRALLLCGGTATAGFGSLGCSTNQGMASLGKVCAVGVASNMFIAIFLLPAWWARIMGGKERGVCGNRHPSGRPGEPLNSQPAECDARSFEPVSPLQRRPSTPASSRRADMVAVAVRYTRGPQYRRTWPRNTLRFSVLGGLLAASSLRATDTNSVLDGWFAAQTNCHTWTAEVVQTRSLKTFQQPLVSTGKVWVVVPDRFRWELGQPPQTVAVRQTGELWLIYPKLKRAERYPLGNGQLGPWKDALALLEASFPRNRAELESRFTVASVAQSNSLVHVALRPKSAFARKFMALLQISVHADDFSPASAQLQFSDGSSMRNDFSHSVIDAPLPDSLFEVNPGPDMKIVEPLKK